MAAETLYASFQTIADAERAIGALIDHGISSSNIGVIARKPAEQDEAERVRAGFTRVTDTPDPTLGDSIVTYEPRPQTLPPAAIADTVVPSTSVDTPDNVETVGKQGITTTTAADAGAGAAIGTGVGLVAGLLAGAASLMIPGVGIVLAAGAVTAALGATVATTAAGAIAGGVAGYLRDMGMSETAASNYAERISQGDYLVAVTVDTSAYDDVRRILLKYNAAGVDTDASPTTPAAGDAVRQAWGNDPALAAYFDADNVRPASAAVVEDPVAVDLNGVPVVQRGVTRDLNGNPIVEEPVVARPVAPSTMPAVHPSASEAALESDPAFDPEMSRY